MQDNNRIYLTNEKSIKKVRNKTIQLSFMLFGVLFFAQENIVSVTIESIDGGPLPGASVFERGTTKGTQTDFDGNYKITASKGAVLIFSYLGMKSIAKIVGDSHVINVTLEEDLQNLDEIVIIVYGSVKKSDLKGSVSSLKAEKVEVPATYSLEGVLAGRVAEVKVIDGVQARCGWVNSNQRV